VRAAVDPARVRAAVAAQPDEHAVPIAVGHATARDRAGLDPAWAEDELAMGLVDGLEGGRLGLGRRGARPEGDEPYGERQQRLPGSSGEVPGRADVQVIARFMGILIQRPGPGRMSMDPSAYPKNA
jgi:hypothetical protein